MIEAIVVALITGIFAVVAQIIIANASTRDLYNKLSRQSEIDDEKLRAEIDKMEAVTDMKITALTHEVQRHNDFARRVPVLEEKVAKLEKYHPIN